MSTPEEKIEAIKAAVQRAKVRLHELESRPRMTRAEIFEKDMIIELINRGERLLKEGAE